MARMRIIAEPNGSGKTYITKWLRNLKEFQFGYYINADDNETTLRSGKLVSFAEYGLTNVTQDAVEAFFQEHPLREKSTAAFSISRNNLHLAGALAKETYFGALLSDFIRQQALANKVSFTFETVMSGSDKLRLLQQAADAGYRVYLYFICTEDPLINIKRVADRVAKLGHHVPDELVIGRYSRTLENLLPAVAFTHRTYMFDNSGFGHKLVCEITNGEAVKLNSEFVPHWFKRHYLNKL